MANIVELREMSDDKLDKLLENAREEMFNLRFQKATAQLDNHARVKIVRREIAQIETVMHMRQLAVDAAASEPAIAAVLSGKEWRANAHFNYEESAWHVDFNDEDDKGIASALVNLNKKRSQSRKGRVPGKPVQLVVSYEVGG
jgi:large subunit ribosomal protein L29